MAERIEEQRAFTQAEFDAFAELSGDHNPIHVDPAFAASTAFGATVAHGMMLFSAIRGLIARQYPAARMLSQELMFEAPTYADETVTLVLEPLGAVDGGELRLATRVIKPDQRLGLSGECVIQLPEQTA
ncbi:MAG: hypothetical protein JJU06_07195 [Ectothiorhodospiraceae bacterium]|nr:hypothetical protein [Ectothiorhodospiraceae bacterium]MCH8505348.1 hypothetical protein [Ectothiorhodospiraceae bacterium]